MIMIKIPNCICNWLGSTIQCQLSSSKLATLPQICPRVNGDDIGCDGDDDDSYSYRDGDCDCDEVAGC